MKLIDIFKNFSWKQKSVAFYVLALFTPMFIGAWALVGLFGIFLGWIGILSFEPNIGLPWIANVIYFIVLIFKKINVKIKLTLTIIMIVFGFFAIGITTVPRDEGGGNYEVTVGIGFGLWILSFVFMFLEQLKQFKKKNLIEKIELTDNGFQINYDKEINQFQWSEIEKLTGFKVDRLTIDDVCLKIESNKKTVYVTEEFEGWQSFMKRLLNEFPQINKNWKGIIAKPAFERKETELYNRNKNVG